MFNRLTLAASAVAVAAFVAGAAAPATAGHDRHERHAHADHAKHHHHKHKRHGKKCPKHVKHALHQLGFVSWDEIEFDDGLWEVDDAIRADGSRWDLKLDPKTLDVVKRKKERSARKR